MPIHHDEFPPQIPPEEEACLPIIFDYERGHLTLEEAAPRLRDAFRAVRSGINLDISPTIRRLFAEGRGSTVDHCPPQALTPIVTPTAAKPCCRIWRGRQKPASWVGACELTRDLEGRCRTSA